MKKKRTRFAFEKLRITDKEFKERIESSVCNQSFDDHCNQVAAKFNIDPIVVKELLLDNSFTVLKLIQLACIKNAAVKINIRGFFSFITKPMMYKKKL